MLNIFKYARRHFRSGDKKTAEILVKHGGDVNVCNNFNESPLYFAADYSDDDENVKLVQFLVEKYVFSNNDFLKVYLLKELVLSCK